MTDQNISSDIDLVSLTETEDTDAGDMADPSSSSTEQTTDCSGTIPTSDLSSSSLDSLQDVPSKDIFQQPLQVLVNVDLTDVTELSNFEELSNLDRKNSCNKEDPDQEPETETAGFAAKLNSRSDWYNHKCFKRYWDHYEHVMSWCQKHYQTYSSLQGKPSCEYTHYTQPCYNTPKHYDWQYVQPAWHHPYSYMASSDHPYSQLSRHNLYSYMPSVPSQKNPNVKLECSDNGSHNRTKSRRSRRKKQKQRERKKKSSSSSEIVTQTDASEAFEMEITSEMIEFFAKSHEHRKQRDEAKIGEQGKEKSEEKNHINVEEVSVSNQKCPTVEAPKERPGARRTSEMKMIYGKGAAMIHGMETALQMTFDRNTDIKQPKTWPNMPLKIVFG